MYLLMVFWFIYLQKLSLKWKVFAEHKLYELHILLWLMCSSAWIPICDKTNEYEVGTFYCQKILKMLIANLLIISVSWQGRDPSISTRSEYFPGWFFWGGGGVWYFGGMMCIGSLNICQNFLMGSSNWPGSSDCYPTCNPKRRRSDAVPEHSLHSKGIQNLQLKYLK